MSRRGGYIKAVTTTPEDIVVLGGDIVGSDPGEDTKVTLTESRAQIVVDSAVKVDVQPSAISLGVGTGQGLQVDADGATVLALPIRKTTASTTLSSADGIVCFDTSSAPLTLTLPDPSTLSPGRFFYVKDLGSAGTNAITVSCGTANVGGGTSHVVDSNRAQIAVVVDPTSTEWLIF